MAVKERTLTQEIAWRLADVYAAQTHGNYDEETLFERGGDWAADEAGKVLSERLGVPTEALEAGVVREMVEAITEIVDHCNWQDEHHPDGRAVVHKLHYSIADNLRHILAKVRGEDGRGK